MVLITAAIIKNDACLREIQCGFVDSMKHNRQQGCSQGEVALSPRPNSPCSPAIRRTNIYQLTPAPQDLMSPRTNIPVALEAMSSVWVPKDPRQRDSSLPVIEGPRGTVRAGENRQKNRYVTVVPPPPRAGTKSSNGVIRSCFSDSFLHSRVEPLDDSLNTGAKPFRGLVPMSRDGRRPSTPIVESTTKGAISARRQRYFSSTDTPRVRAESEKRALAGRSDSPKKQPNRTRGNKAQPKGDCSHKNKELKDAVKEIDNGSFCVWREKTRSLRRASESSGKTAEAEPPVADEESKKVTDKEEKVEKVKKEQEIVINHLNYCSSRKTTQVVKWLQEVNMQESFDIIE